MFENLVLRTILLTLGAYFLALIVARIMGRKLVSQMTFFDFVIGVTMGSVTANLVLNPNGPITGTTMLITLAVLTVIMGYGYIYSMSLRKMINSEPVVVIDKGQIVNQNLTKLRINLDDLLMLLRIKNIFNIADVEYAVMETNGQLTVLKKAEKQPPTVSDLNISRSYQGLTRDLVFDGNLLEENLRSTNIAESDFMSQLQGQGIHDIKDVFYAGLDSTGTLYVSRKQNRSEYEGQYGIN